jgi:hypothetical protein
MNNIRVANAVFGKKSRLYKENRKARLRWLKVVEIYLGEI